MTKRTSQQDWNSRNLNKLKAAADKQRQKCDVVTLRFYRDRPSDVTLLDWLKSQAGNVGIAATVVNILQKAKNEDAPL